jgi:hypothetical protein
MCSLACLPLDLRIAAVEQTDAKEEASRTELLAVVEELDGLGRRLQAIHDSLPVTPEESDLRDLDRDPPAAMEIRTVIRNVQLNSLKPAVEDLRAAAAYRPGMKLEGPRSGR